MSPSNLGVYSLLPLLLIASPKALQTSAGAGPKVGTIPVVVCADSVTDQDGGGCMQASSVATSGLLFPYPGSGNSFTATALVAGGINNVANGSNAFVGGGNSNTASHANSQVSGGQNNLASGANSTVGGGANNTASGYNATVSGGRVNTASASRSTVAGGSANSASQNGATVMGGALNDASASYATVAGGYRSTALGAYSFVAGRSARANHAGSFVWGDSVVSIPSTKTSSAADQFNVYASGGTRIFSNSAATTGVLLAAGGSSWTMVSDRNAKENFQQVDPRDVLEHVTEIPISTWNYKEQDDSVRHMGPMAQDFWAAFGLGLGDKTIDTIDPGGVALAAIQGLDQKLAEKGAEVAEQLAKKDAEVADLRQTNEQLRAEFEALRTQLLK